MCFHSTAILVGKFLSQMYPHNADIRAETAVSAYYSGKYRLSYNIFSAILSFKNLSESESAWYRHNRHFSINHIADKYIQYNKSIVNRINRHQRPLPLVTFTITTCKRFDLFEKTMNSFLNCCLDLDKIDRWFCVDDNSTEEDRKKMQELYPFFTFYFKTPEEKGHPRSMNIIRNNVCTEYVFHLEDDWKFFYPQKYISQCMDVLGSDAKIGQCLLNKNYAEIATDINIAGGLLRKTKKGLRYFIHEYTSNNEERNAFYAKYPNRRNCAYWPHFSFRPSLLKRKVLDDLGPYNEKSAHFEMDYSRRYVQKGYVSAFLDGINSIHIGRLTSQRCDKSVPNAYQLNGQDQFVKKEKVGEKENLRNYFEFIPGMDQMGNDCYRYRESIDQCMKRCLEDKNCAGFNTLGFFKTKIEILSKSKHFSARDGLYVKKKSKKTVNPKTTEQIISNTIVINLDRRQDRMKVFAALYPLNYTRFSAVDGKSLKPNVQLQRIFEGNDYNMRAGMVGCAMSHIKIYIDLINSPGDRKILVLEDDITLVPDFVKKFQHVLKTPHEWDMIYLGHHLYPRHYSKEYHSKDKLPTLEKWSSRMSLTKSMGGTYGYLISKNGALKLLEYINKNGMTNGIDTVQQKAIGFMNVYYCNPHLVYSECVLPGKRTDTDIQYDYKSLTMKSEDFEKLVSEGDGYEDRLKKDGKYNVDDALTMVKRFKITQPETNFQFTNNWFDRNINISMKLLQSLFTKQNNILEIGSHEGKSSVWMLDNLCNTEGSTFTSIDPYLTDDKTSPVTSDTYKRFCHNIKLCKNSGKFNQHVGTSRDILPKLIAEQKSYNIIYVDGSHLMDDVLSDLEHSHQLLQPGGVILLDDVGFEDKDTDVMGAAKIFLNKYPEYTIILKEYQWMLRRFN